MVPPAPGVRAGGVAWMGVSVLEVPAQLWNVGRVTGLHAVPARLGGLGEELLAALALKFEDLLTLGDHLVGLALVLGPDRLEALLLVGDRDVRQDLLRLGRQGVPLALVHRDQDVGLEEARIDPPLGELVPAEGIEKLEWVPIEQLSSYNLVPPPRKLFKKIGYL